MDPHEMTPPEWYPEYDALGEPVPTASVWEVMLGLAAVPLAEPATS